MAKRQRTIYDLRWADEPGIEVAMRACSVGDLLALEGMAGKADESREGAESLLRDMARYLVSWNLEDDSDVPIPATYEGLLTQDLGFALKIFKGWYGAMTSVDNPLPPGSPNGEPSAPVPPIPVEPLSSPPSS